VKNACHNWLGESGVGGKWKKAFGHWAWEGKVKGGWKKKKKKGAKKKCKQREVFKEGLGKKNHQKKFLCGSGGGLGNARGGGRDRKK